MDERVSALVNCVMDGRDEFLLGGADRFIREEGHISMRSLGPVMNLAVRGGWWVLAITLWQRV